MVCTLARPVPSGATASWLGIGATATSHASAYADVAHRAERQDLPKTVERHKGPVNVIVPAARAPRYGARPTASAPASMPQGPQADSAVRKSALFPGPVAYVEDRSLKAAHQRTLDHAGPYHAGANIEVDPAGGWR